jgi:uncharacterized membrane protein
VTAAVTPPVPDDTDVVELAIARLLLAGTLAGMSLLAAGVTLMAINGLEPNAEAFPAFDPSAIVGDLLALRPEGFLWAGILVIVATPIARVTGELIAFARRRDRLMTAIAAGILVVVILSVLVAVAAEVV